MSNVLTFSEALNRFTKSVANTRRYALRCAELALDHFAKHGDLIYVQAFYDAMSSETNRNFVRHAAFGKWMIAFAPVKFSSGKFTKDGDRVAEFSDYAVDGEACPVNRAGASEKPFWEFAPSNEQVVQFTDDDVLKAVATVLRRFDNPAKYAPVNDRASSKLASIKAAVGNLGLPQASNLGLPQASNLGLPQASNLGLPQASNLGLPQASNLGLQGASKAA